jgi:hypothetical protein
VTVPAAAAQIVGLVSAVRPSDRALSRSEVEPGRVAGFGKVLSEYLNLMAGKA